MLACHGRLAVEAVQGNLVWSSYEAHEARSKPAYEGRFSLLNVLVWGSLSVNTSIGPLVIKYIKVKENRKPNCKIDAYNAYRTKGVATWEAMTMTSSPNEQSAVGSGRI